MACACNDNNLVFLFSNHTLGVWQLQSLPAHSGSCQVTSSTSRVAGRRQRLQAVVFWLLATWVSPSGMAEINARSIREHITGPTQIHVAYRQNRPVNFVWSQGNFLTNNKIQMKWTRKHMMPVNRDEQLNTYSIMELYWNKRVMALERNHRFYRDHSTNKCFSLPLRDWGSAHNRSLTLQLQFHVKDKHRQASVFLISLGRVFPQFIPGFAHFCNIYFFFNCVPPTLPFLCLSPMIFQFNDRCLLFSIPNTCPTIFIFIS